MCFFAFKFTNERLKEHEVVMLFGQGEGVRGFWFRAEGVTRIQFAGRRWALETHGRAVLLAPGCAES